MQNSPEPVIPGIQCECSCGKRWNVAFVPWSFSPADAFKCKSCRKWAKNVTLFRNEADAPEIPPAPPV